MYSRQSETVKFGSKILFSDVRLGWMENIQSLINGEVKIYWAGDTDPLERGPLPGPFISKNIADIPLASENTSN